MLRVLLFVSASLYGASFVATTVVRSRPPHVAQLSLHRRLLLLALLSHVGFTLFRAWCMGRLPFVGKPELLSWFGLSCAVLCLIGAGWLRSRMVIASGVLCAFIVTASLAVWHEPCALPGIDIIQGAMITWYGAATPLAYAAGVLAFAAQLRGILAAGRPTGFRDTGGFDVSEESMNAVSAGLVRFAFPLMLSGLLAFGLGSLEAVGLGWFWQRSIAAQLFTVVAYSILLHLSVSRPASRGAIVVAQSAALCGIIVSFLSFDAPHGLMRGVGLDIFL
ncbi:MAG: hypothetical protein JSW03_05650 [Candidatus Eiseniibacteriota bacterium]|nr:MAG: hypothetical protein JSW03_05650 [Candidatus Eisenbacteria bacterium]